MTDVLVTALYQFVPLDSLETWRDELHALCEAHALGGTLLVAREGINGTLAGMPDQVRQFLRQLTQYDEFADIPHKESTAPKLPFKRLKVRIKQEIVSMGVTDLDVTRRGQYVDPQDWNALISDPDVLVIDTRNDYEVEVGRFEGAVSPETQHFRQLPHWLNTNESLTKKPKVAMYCTGGIRCEKSTAYLRSKGFDDVYHLKGGILKYLEIVPETESMWSGECFVFDERVTVNHQLEPGVHALCFGCRRPVHPDDMQSEKYQEGVSCPHCYDDLTESQKERFLMRHSQYNRAGRDDD